MEGYQGDTVDDWMSKVVASMPGHKTALEAAQLMSSQKIGSIVILQSTLLKKNEKKILGILTETDIARKVIAKGLALERTRVDAIMTPKPFILDGTATIMAASSLFTQHRIKRIPVTKKGMLAGIFTVTDLMNALVKIGKLYEIAELVKYIAKKKIGAKEFGSVVMADKWMSPDIITCTNDQTVAEVAKLMDVYKVGDIVVMDGEEVTGIVTDTDIVRKACIESKDPNIIKAIEIMSSPVITTTPDTPLIDVANMMNEKKIKRLVIMENDHLKGLLSVTDLIDALIQLNNFAQAHKIIDMLYDK